MPRKRTPLTEQRRNELQRAYRTTKDGAERTRYQAVWWYGQTERVYKSRRERVTDWEARVEKNWSIMLKTHRIPSF